MSAELPRPSAESLAAMRTTRPWTMEDAAVTADRLRAVAVDAAVGGERQRILAGFREVILSSRGTAKWVEILAIVDAVEDTP